MQALSPSAFSSRAARRSCARNAERLRSQLLGTPKRAVRDLAKCSAQQIVSGVWCVSALHSAPEGNRDARAGSLELGFDV